MPKPALTALLSSILLAAAGNPPQAPAKPEPPAPAQSDVVMHCKPQTGLPREKLRFLGEEWDAELCLDEASRRTGMGARTEFPAGTAMIFVHPKPTLLSFWMKDCLIDLDIVFVDADGKICALHEAKKERLRLKSESLEMYEARLARYGSNRRAKYAIELPAGTVARLKPSLGQKIEADLSKLDALAK